ncbi:MAG TPA: aldose 1-epimerase [Solirubrobacteraceae bacterium]|nr:aldose 1-epimerase [Solirubrobacteraceae bacterium]
MASPARVLRTEVDGFPAVTLAGPGDILRATFIPSLGMVGCSLIDGDDELLARRGGPPAYAERGSSFGIPLLHPWANRLSSWTYTAGGRSVEIPHDSPVAHLDGATGLPMHGLLTASPNWVVVDATVDDDGAPRLRAELDFAAHPALLAAFPFPHVVALDVSLRAGRLAVRLTLTPTGDVAVPISFGFHPYVRLPGSDRRTWSVELPVRRRAVLDGRGIPTGATDRVEDGECSGRLGDRAFDDSFDELQAPPAGQPITFSVADDRRRLAVELVDGYTVAHVFAPAASDFICFEPMTAPVDALTTGDRLRSVAPGSSFAAEFAISVAATTPAP